MWEDSVDFIEDYKLEVEANLERFRSMTTDEILKEYGLIRPVGFWGNIFYIFNCYERIAVDACESVINERIKFQELKRLDSGRFHASF